MNNGYVISQRILEQARLIEKQDFVENALQ